MKVITGARDNRLSYEQNAEGKYDVMITSYEKTKHHRTGFIFDSIKLMNEFLLRVSQTDSDGNKKFGLIAVNGWSQIYHPCNFDKIKPYKGFSVQAYIGEEEFIIASDGDVYSREFWDMEHEY